MKKLLFCIPVLVMLGSSPVYSQDSFSDMDYSQFLEFCKQDASTLSDSMTANERLVSNLCDFQAEGFGQKQWHWLNGTNLDWNGFAKKASSEHANMISEFAESGIKETLHVNSFVSTRDSFPPGMSAVISFDFAKNAQVRHYDEKFLICMNGNLLPTNYVYCTDEYVKYDFTNKESFVIQKYVEKTPLPSGMRSQMLDWCQNSPKNAQTNKYWDAIPVRLVSDADEFKLLHGIKDSFVVNSIVVDQSCPPHVQMSGTFVSESGNRHRFALEYDMNNFRYQIDKTALADDRPVPTPRQQMKMGVPLYEIKCKEGFYPTFKIDRVTPACVTETTLDKLLIRGWSPLRLGMPAETNILITYGAIQIFPHNVTQKLDLNSPHYNTIFWVNNDIIPHTILGKDGTWSTGMIESGKIGFMIFNQTGVYEYFVKEKPSTTGFVEFSGIVEIED